VSLGLLVALPAARLTAQPAHAPLAPERASEAYLRALVAEARARELAEARTWHVLLHYVPARAGGGVTSLADAEAFFLAPDGKRNPAGELDATLEAFFAPAAPAGEEDTHPQCGYPARYRWLADELGFDSARLPPRACPDFTIWRQALGGTGVTLIFAEAYLNNPSSMFGHTLMRVDAAPPDAGEERRDLLAYAVNFAAFTNEDKGLAYAWEGITGGYPGYFSIAPYYDKVKEYGDWESRDLWEYRVDLEPDEIDRMLRHLYELREVDFDYYFFGENCSYQLLGLLEVARPSLELRSRFPAWAIPSDTVREVVAQAGLTGTVIYRPSATTRLRHQGAAAGRTERGLARELAAGDLAPDAPEVLELSPGEQSAVLGMAHDRLQLEVGAHPDAGSRRRSLAILRARSAVPVTGDPAGAPPVPRVRPDEGHGTARVSLGYGIQDDDTFVELRIRPALHDLLDPIGGYVPGARIQVANTVVRYYPGEGDFKLQELTLLDIESLATRDELFQPVAWKFRTGTRQMLVGHRDDGDLRNAFTWQSHGGGGLAYQPWHGSTAYAFLEGNFDVSGKLDPNYAVGLGASVGLLTGAHDDRWRGHLRLAAMEYLAGDRRTAWSASLGQRLTVLGPHTLELRVAAEYDFGETWLDAGVWWNVSF
jgi:hypothetical protein